MLLIKHLAGVTKWLIILFQRLTLLDAMLQVDGTFSISSSTLSATGPAQPEILSSSAAQYKVRMTPEGIYYFTGNTTGPDGNPYQDTVAIMVTNKDQMDVMLSGKWEGMRGALAIGDTNTALASLKQVHKKYTGRNLEPCSQF